jgi:hypothetical protein
MGFGGWGEEVSDGEGDPGLTPSEVSRGDWGQMGQICFRQTRNTSGGRAVGLGCGGALWTAGFGQWLREWQSVEVEAARVSPERHALWSMVRGRGEGRGDKGSPVGADSTLVLLMRSLGVKACVILVILSVLGI